MLTVAVLYVNKKLNYSPSFFVSQCETFAYLHREGCHNSVFLSYCNGNFIALDILPSK